ncbi:hypothetical protein EPN18_05150 [bacterium]|nr:MAG: hypothetical protein EPN18_05150 [bacterium]
MKRVWQLFSSVTLTVWLAAITCAVTAWGSIIVMKHPQYYRGLDQTVLLQGLLHGPAVGLKLTLWIYALILLTFLFTVNTVVCTTDRVYSVIKFKAPLKSLYPHIVHVGFVVAVLGHLAGSVAGFRSYGNTLTQGEIQPVPYTEGLFMRLDSFEMTPTPEGEVESLNTKITLLSGDAKNQKEALTGNISINSPLLYKGIAFYHMDQGQTPAGLRLDTGFETASVRFYGSSKLSDGGELTLGALYPDFAIDNEGRPASLSEEFRNPHVEVMLRSPAGAVKRAFLNVSRPGGAVTLGALKIQLADYVMSPFVVLTVNKDPGITLIIAGSLILTVGMMLLLFFRGERSELLKR